MLLWFVSEINHIMLEHMLLCLVALSCHLWRRPMVWCAVVCVWRVAWRCLYAGAGE
jgi:hypothetical protein